MWALSVYLEYECNNIKGCLFNLSKALKECQTDGILWSLAIDLEPKANRKKKIKDALNYCENDPYVHASVAKIFWSEKKHDKVRKWLEKALVLDENIGDHWALLYLFE